MSRIRDKYNFSRLSYDLTHTNFEKDDYEPKPEKAVEKDIFLRRNGSKKFESLYWDSMKATNKNYIIDNALKQTDLRRI